MAMTSCSRGFPSLFSSLSLRDSKPVVSFIVSRHLNNNNVIRNRQQLRAQSTARRTTKRLRVKPAASAPKPHASAVTHTSHSEATPANVTSISFDPPSAAPSPFHTPSLFLPENDPRRKLHASTVHASSWNPYSAATNSNSNSSSSPSSSSSSSSSQRLPPALHMPKDKRYHLTEADIKEMRELRRQDPKYWTRPRLALKFGCSEMFVSISSPAQVEHRRAFWAKQRERLMSDGPKKRKARADRLKRKELWYSDA